MNLLLLRSLRSPPAGLSLGLRPLHHDVGVLLHVPAVRPSAVPVVSSQGTPFAFPSTSTSTTQAGHRRFFATTAPEDDILFDMESLNGSSPPTKSSSSSKGAAGVVSAAPKTVDEESVFDQESYFAGSYDGMAAEPFDEKVASVLLQPVNKDDVEIKPDGIIYLPEIKYRRILNLAFGPGGWALVPRGPHTRHKNSLSREFALFARGRFVAQSRGEQMTREMMQMGAASEGCKSNALMRCCKDIGVASELWDPNFIQTWKKDYAVQVLCKLKYGSSAAKLLWRRKDRPALPNYVEVDAAAAKPGKA